jgi:Glycosyltransferase
MKRILVYGMTDIHGGIESYIMNIYRRLDKSKIIFDFVCIFDSMVFEDEVRAAGSHVYYIPTKSKRPIQHLLSFRRLLKQHPEYETIYFNILNAGAAFSMGIPHRLKRRVLVHSHNSLDDNMKLHNIFKSRLLKYTDVKLACSVKAAQYMFGDENIADCEIIHNAIEISRFTFDFNKRSEVRSEFAIGDEEIVILHVGRITNQKNPHFLIKIMAAFVKFTPNAKLFYVGVGPMENEIRQAVLENHIENNVVFMGSRNDVPDLMQAADAFLLPSLYEGLPIVAVEAQAASLPAILSENISHEVKISDLVAFISLKDNPEIWAKVISKFIEHSERKDRTSDIEQSGYDIDHEIARIKEILMGVSNGTNI